MGFNSGFKGLTDDNKVAVSCKLGRRAKQPIQVVTGHEFQMHHFTPTSKLSTTEC